MQLLDIVNPKILYQNYAYYTGASKPLINHFSILARKITNKYKPAIVLEIGGNDGTCLEQFQKRGIKVVNVEPSINVGKKAEEKKIDTYNQFWDCDCRKKIESEYGKVDIIIATNVLAHVDSLRKFIQNIYFLLKPNGVFIFEVPYLGQLIKKVEYDTIYHEHLSYFSIFPLITLLKDYNMEIIGLEHLAIHGGSIRVEAKKIGNKVSTTIPQVQNLLLRNLNNKGDLDKIETFIDFSIKIKLQKSKLINRLNTIKSKGYKIIGYGATAKGNTLLNYCNIDNSMLEYIVDTTAHKQGKLTPGTHIPIVSDKEFQHKAPKYTLLLAWNYQKEIMEKEKEYIEKGGTFILPHQI